MAFRFNTYQSNNNNWRANSKSILSKHVTIKPKLVNLFALYKYAKNKPLNYLRNIMYDLLWCVVPDVNKYESIIENIENITTYQVVDIIYYIIIKIA